ncbi:MAG: hypothetical protein QOF30_3456 [Acidimicrobiaceae bacterium]|nr:hypothetical protein [Acidimicrobiaceae bacterium]
MVVVVGDEGDVYFDVVEDGGDLEMAPERFDVVAQGGELDVAAVFEP